MHQAVASVSNGEHNALALLAQYESGGSRSPAAAYAKIGLGARVGCENGEDDDDNHGDKWKNDQKADVDEEADTELISESFCDSDMSRP